MPHPLFGVRDDGCQTTVQLASELGSRLGVEDGRKQRVGEADALPLELDDTALDRLVQTLAACPLYELDGRFGKGGCNQKRLLCRRGKRAQPLMNQSPEQIGHLQGPAGLDCSSLELCPRQLESVERIAPGSLADRLEHPPRQASREARADQALDGAETEWIDRAALERLQRARRKFGIARDAVVALVLLPPRQQHPAAVVLDAPEDEPEHARRGGVEPLHVVNGDQERCLFRHGSEQGERRERDSPLVGRMAVGLAQQQADLERFTLRRRKPGEVVLGQVVEHVAQSREGERHLGR